MIPIIYSIIYLNIPHHCRSRNSLACKIYSVPLCPAFQVHGTFTYKFHCLHCQAESNQVNFNMMRQKHIKN